MGNGVWSYGALGSLLKRLLKHSASMWLWVTINEPMVYVLEGYLVAQWPPQKKNKFLAARSALEYGARIDERIASFMRGERDDSAK